MVAINGMNLIARPGQAAIFEAEDGPGVSVRYDFPSLQNTVLYGPNLDAIAQLQGYSTAKVVEVEANTLAMRVLLAYDDLPLGNERAYQITRHSVGMPHAFNFGSAAGGENPFLSLYFGVDGFCAINKVTVSMSTSVLTGTRAATCPIYLTRWNSTGGMPAPWAVPINGQAVISGVFDGRSCCPLRINQGEPCTQIDTGTSFAGSRDANPLAQVNVALGGGVAGTTDLKPTVLHDVLAGSGQPIILLTNAAIGLYANFPALLTGTAQSFQLGTTLQWEEWIPIAKWP